VLQIIPLSLFLLDQGVAREDSLLLLDALLAHPLDSIFHATNLTIEPAGQISKSVLNVRLIPLFFIQLVSQLIDLLLVVVFICMELLGHLLSLVLELLLQGSKCLLFTLISLFGPLDHLLLKIIYLL
jgi:hypothetical protein